MEQPLSHSSFWTLKYHFSSLINAFAWYMHLITLCSSLTWGGYAFSQEFSFFQMTCTRGSLFKSFLVRVTFPISENKVSSKILLSQLLCFRPLSFVTTAYAYSYVLDSLYYLNFQDCYLLAWTHGLADYFLVLGWWN